MRVKSENTITECISVVRVSNEKYKIILADFKTLEVEAFPGFEFNDDVMCRLLRNGFVDFDLNQHRLGWSARYEEVK